MNFGHYNGKRVVEFENLKCNWAFKLNQFGLYNETLGFIMEREQRNLKMSCAVGLYNEFWAS